MVAANSGSAVAAKTALTASGKPKEKRRNNEKRKEKSREAARCRRSRETEIFTDLAKVLPLKKEDVNQLDKASIMRIAIVYLKVREMLQFFPNIQAINDADSSATDTEETSEDESPKLADDSPFDLLQCEDAYQILKETLDGFLLILSNDGDIAYVSESVTDYLGLAKIDILGQQIWEYSHQCDHAELREAMNMKRNGQADKVKDEQILEDGLSTDHRDLFVRFKCTLTSRGRSINIKSASYKLIHLTGHLVVNTKGDRVLIAIGRPIPHPINIETPLCASTFLTKHSLDMKFTYADDKMQTLLGYKPEDLLEKPLFNCHHGSDTESLMTTFKTVLSKGQGETCRYRFLGKFGGFCWIVTQATVVYDKLKPQSVVCVNYVISNLENDHEIYSLEQFEASQSRVKTEEINIKNNNNNNNRNNSSDNKKTNNNNINSESKNNSNNKEIKPNDDEKPITKPTSAPDLKPLTNESSSNNHNNNNNNNNSNIHKIQNTISIDVLKSTCTKTAAANIDNNSNSNSSSSSNANANSIEKNPIKRLHFPLPPTTTTATPTTAASTTPLPPTKTVTHTLISKSRKSSSSPPRPKSVTASVFRAAPNILPAIVTKNNTNSNNNNNSNKSTDINSSAKNNNNNKNATNKIDNFISPISQTNKPNHHQQQLSSNNNSNNNNSSKATTTTLATLATQQQHRDMNKGFLTFAEDATNDELTMLKVEPDDLAHLAPPPTNVVDACMPLDETTPLFNEMLVGLMSSYESLLPDDINSLDSTTSSTTTTTATTAEETTAYRAAVRAARQAGCEPSAATRASITTKINCKDNSNKHYNSSYNNNNNDINGATTTSTSALLNNNNSNKSSAHIDPFINYREESNDTNCSQHLLSPSVPSTSPEASSLPSLCSPNSLSQEDEFAFMTMSVDDDIDLTMRAPYIPMNEQDDLPLLTDDLMWCSSNAFNSDDMQKDISDVMQQQLQQLQQIQAACDNSELRGNIIDYITTPIQHAQLPMRQQHHQQQLLLQQNLSNQFSNSLCSSPASATSSLSPSPVNSNMQHNTQHDTNTANVFGSDSSELAALLCGSGNGTLTILGNMDNQSVIGGNGNNGNGGSGDQHINNFATLNIGGCGVGGGGALNSSGINFRQQMISPRNDENLQRQQQLICGLNIVCKKEKLDANALATSLCDSIEDAFENVYNKDSTNLDCWNDFSPMNVSDGTSLTTADLQRRQLELEYQNENCKQQLAAQQQELLFNAVPLITIQNTKNVVLQRDQHQQHQQLQDMQEHAVMSNNDVSNNHLNKIIVNDEMLSAIVPANRSAVGGKMIKWQKLFNNNVPALHVVESKLEKSQQATLQRNQTVTKTTIMPNVAPNPQQQHANKRHHNSNSNSIQFETKRLKSAGINSTEPVHVELQATPQLLQQLIAPQPQPQPQIKAEAQHQAEHLKTNSQTWCNQSKQKPQQVSQTQQPKQPQQQHQQQQHQQQQQQQQQSESVLKNLLLSGCDDVDPSKRQPLYLDESSLDKGSPTSPFSNASLSPNEPMHCNSPKASVLRNYRHNPMIGGPGILPSPTLMHNEDSSSPPGLITAYDPMDSSSDSGIDDANSMDTGHPTSVAIDDIDGVKLPLKLELNKNGIETKREQDDLIGHGLLLMKCTGSDNRKTPNLDSISNVVVDNSKISNDSNSNIRRKTSISFMDSSNPLLTPFLMDLCNDDYNMNTVEFTEENDIESVLNQWSGDLA